MLFPKNPISLTPKEEAALRIGLKILGRELRIAERTLRETEGRYMDLLLPLLVSLLDCEHEQYKEKDFGGTMGRFEVAQSFTSAGFKMDFRFAERLLDYATKKKKVYLVFDSDRGQDDSYGSKAAYDKYNPQ